MIKGPLRNSTGPMTGCHPEMDADLWPYPAGTRSGPSGYLHGPGKSEAEKEAFDFCSLSAALSVTPWLGGFQQHGWDRPTDEEDPEAF
ncbi:hypothetical protein SRHO_G00073400 [Serrasalmus rhombeus]